MRYVFPQHIVEGLLNRVPVTIVVLAGIAFFRPPLATGIGAIEPLNAVRNFLTAFSAIAVAAVRCWDGWRMCAHLLESSQRYKPVRPLLLTNATLVTNATLTSQPQLTYSDHISAHILDLLLNHSLPIVTTSPPTS